MSAQSLMYTRAVTGDTVEGLLFKLEYILCHTHSQQSRVGESYRIKKHIVLIYWLRVLTKMYLQCIKIMKESELQL